MKKIIFAVFGLVLLLYAGIFIVSALNGNKCFYVTNGSMGNAAPFGSLIVTEQTPYEQLSVGDIVSFYDSEGANAFTHRITEKDDENRLLYTKGDANNVEDPVPASYDYFAGRVVWVVPFLGFISMVLHSPFGVAAVLCILAVFVIAEIIILKKRRGGAK